ncbi:MAG: lytic transglycosylase domain-containing protein [Spirochaetaceae bacterium]|nr:lytic transglycosylase domain-containing protein [Spirochaetaceae bacterium]
MKISKNHYTVKKLQLMKIQTQNITCVLTLFFALAMNNCTADTVLGIPRQEAGIRLKSGDIRFIIDAEPSRAAELSKIHTALPFYVGLLLEAEYADNERAKLLFIEALKDPSVRAAALKKLSPVREEEEVQFDGPMAAGRTAIARKDYNEALRLFREGLDGGAEAFILDKDLLGDLGKAFQFAVIQGEGAAAPEGAELFLEWESGLREGNKLWALPESGRNEIRYMLLYYAGRMRRQLGEYVEAETLFGEAFSLAPDSEQADACIWYILNASFAKNKKNPEETTVLIKKYAPLWNDPGYFSDFFEEFTHSLCLYRRWDEMAEIFPAIRAYGGPELTAKYAFILGNAVELNFLQPQKAAAVLKSVYFDRNRTADSQLANAFYRIAYNSDVTAGLDTRSFYYTSAAAKKLGREPRLNMPGGSGRQAEFGLTNEFLYGFFRFGAARFAYPYIMEQAAELSVQELRALAELLASAERWGESIRIARTYMRRPGYIANRADLYICYPFAYTPLVEKFSRETGMDKYLLYGLIRTESIFTPDIVSRAGASGLTQLMPDTAREVARALVRAGGQDYFGEGGLDLRVPALNINLGAMYFQRLKERTNSTLLALLSYNGGVNRIRRWRGARPDLNEALFLESVDYAETRDYGRQVLTAAAIYRCLDSAASK